MQGKDLREFFKPTFRKIILTFTVFILLLSITSVPVELYYICKPGVLCPKVRFNVSALEFILNLIFGKGLLPVWNTIFIGFIIFAEFVISYLTSSAIIFAYQKYKIKNI